MRSVGRLACRRGEGLPFSGGGGLAGFVSDPQSHDIAGSYLRVMVADEGWGGTGAFRNALR